MPVCNLIESTKSLVLIADDEHLVIEYVNAFLRKVGYDVLTARDAAGAWELFQRERTRLRAVVTDLVMPGDWDGLELIRRVRAATPQTPVVLATGYSLPAAVVTLRCALLRKPFSTDALQSALQRASALTA